MAIASENQPKTPFFSTAAKTFLRRRGGEATGLAFFAAGALMSLALLSYDSTDPSWFKATDKPPSNILGGAGAYLADGLVQSIGLASGGLALLFLVWAWRLILHRGEGRIWSRLALTAPTILIGAAFASSHAPYAAWPYQFGLGGMFGDWALGALLEALPGPGDWTIRLIGLVLGALTAFLVALAFGVDRHEAVSTIRFLWRSVMHVLWLAWRLVVAGVAWGAAGLHRRLSATRSELVAPPNPIGARRHDVAPVREEDTDEPPISRPVAAPSEPSRAPVERPAPRSRKSRRAQKEEQPTLDLEGFEDPDAYRAPGLALLQAPQPITRAQNSDAALEENARMLESVLDDYGVRGEIVAVKPGPVVTLYELEPAPGLKASRVIGLADDIARSMCAVAARVSTVPGRNVIGIELPNAHREKVLLREMLASPKYGDANYPLTLALGKDIAGEPVVANLARMPHLLIAGTTGSGKSVAINTMILSLLYRLSPQQCRLIMIDPKMLELSVYDGIPHLLSPVVTDPKKAVVALKWVVREMEERYRKMSKVGVRNIDGYNARVREAIDSGEGFSRTVQTGFDEATGQPIYETEEFEPEEMPLIVVIVDEMADLMMVAGKEIEACIQRLAQMARASGIHIIMATQRPSVDVITGTIKANFPTRISFQVTSKVDSRTILGEQGAEQLLGMGDMLYMSGGGRITRVHGPFCSDEEVEQVVAHLKTLGTPEYVSAVTDENDDDAGSMDEILGLGGDSDENELYDRAVLVVARDRKASTSYIQRKLQIGYNRAARLIEQMEEQGVVSSANHVGKREVLVGEVD